MLHLLLLFFFCRWHKMWKYSGWIVYEKNKEEARLRSMQQCSENLTKCELQLLKRKYLKIHNVLFTICHMVFDKLLPHSQRDRIQEMDKSEVVKMGHWQWNFPNWSSITTSSVTVNGSPGLFFTMSVLNVPVSRGKHKIRLGFELFRPNECTGVVEYWSIGCLVAMVFVAIVLIKIDVLPGETWQ